MLFVDLVFREEKIMIICGIDFETTGVDPKVDRPTEIGAVLWDESWNKLGEFSSFMYESNYPTVPEHVTKLTGGIDDALLKKEGRPPNEVMGDFFKFAINATYMIAHNAKFDKAFFEELLGRLPGEDAPIWNKPWLCSMTDIAQLKDFKCWKLSHLALDHGVTVVPSQLHRAVGDVELIGDFCRAGGYKIKDIAAYATVPWIVVKAAIPKPWDDHGVGKALARERGFRWEQVHGDKRTFSKRWVKRIKGTELEELTALMKPYVVIPAPQC